MRYCIRDLVEISSHILPCSSPILEFGSFQVPGQEHFADLRCFFKDKLYIGADMRIGTGVEMLQNLHNIGIKSKSIGTILLLDTIEHVEYTREALFEIHRILADDGILIMTSVFNYPIHDFPYDYWRFTPEAFKSLLKEFAYCFVDSLGAATLPHTIIGIGFKIEPTQKVLNSINEQLAAWKSKHSPQTDSFLKAAVKQVLPPLLLRTIQNVKRKIV